MKSEKFLLSLFLLCTAQVLYAEVNDFDDDDGVTVEDEKFENPQLPNDSDYKSPYLEPGKYHLAEHFDDENSFQKKWVQSKATKSDSELKYDGLWSLEPPMKPLLSDDLGLVLKSKAKHSAVSTRLNKPFVFSDKPLIVQYEVQWQDGQECGGSYIKLLSSGKDTTDLTQFHDKTPFTIMFGPDKCGNDHKLHFIFRHVNPVNGTIEEKHSRKPKERIEEAFIDKQPHLYQLVVKPDNTFTIRVDNKIVNEGSLLEDFEPPVNPPREIDDPNDKRPENWDDREKIPDPSAVKPEDWDEDEPPQIPDPNASKPEGWLDDEEEMIPDPNAVKPDDWDNEIDGEWEAPLIANPACEKAVGCGLWKAPMASNPKYRGKWRAPLIDNPNYQGKWAPKRIPNPDYFEDLTPFKMTPISAVGLELWSMSQDILFDNLLVTDDYVVAEQWTSLTFELKRKQIDKEAESPRVPTININLSWYTTYAIYCVTPVCIYVWYLWKRTKEETLVNRVMKLTNEKPWLWAVFVLVGGLPVTLFIYFRCTRKDKPSDAGQRKKTDETEKDDDENEEEEELSAKKRVSQKPTKKSDLDQPITNDGSSSSVDEELVEVDENESIEDISESTNKPNIEQPSEGSRKRKPRKE